MEIHQELGFSFRPDELLKKIAPKRGHLIVRDRPRKATKKTEALVCLFLDHRILSGGIGVGASEKPSLVM